MSRANEDGWILCSMNDPSGRRGLWFRVSEDSTCVEICAGREGDDLYLTLSAGEAITLSDLAKLIDALRSILMVRLKSEYCKRLNHKL